nr:TMV resistance protein N [Tanacetum cinerariifolium]
MWDQVTLSFKVVVKMRVPSCFKQLRNLRYMLLYYQSTTLVSVGCLDELVLIMDCLHKFKRRKVFPILFNVNPSDVRSQQGSLEEDFEEHENNVDQERVQK